MCATIIWTFVEGQQSIDLINDKNKFNCAIKYLKSLNKLKKSFKEETVKKRINLDCEKTINEGKKLLDMKFRQKYGERFDSQIECVLFNLVKHGWFDDILLERVYAKSSHVPASDKPQIEEKYRKESVSNITKYYGACEKVVEKNAAVFNNIFVVTNESESEEDKIEEYCVQKYIVDKGLIDPTYNVDLNSDDIKLEKVDCEQSLNSTIKALNVEFEKTLRKSALTKEFVTCFMEKYFELKFYERLISVHVLTKLNLSKPQVDSERKKFADAMTHLENTAINCD